MSIALIVTLGFGNGTLNGSIPDVVTLGYDISTVIPPTIPDSNGLSGSGALGLGLLGTGSAGSGVSGSGSL